MIAWSYGDAFLLRKEVPCDKLASILLTYIIQIFYLGFIIEINE